MSDQGLNDQQQEEFQNQPEVIENNQDEGQSQAQNEVDQNQQQESFKLENPADPNFPVEDATTLNYKKQVQEQENLAQSEEQSQQKSNIKGSASSQMEQSVAGQNLPDLNILGNASIIKQQQQENQQEIDEMQEVEQEIPKIPDDFFYEENHVETQIADSEISKNAAQFYECFGFDTAKKYNVSMLDNDNLIYSAGITYQIFNIVTREIRPYFSKDQGGIGSIAVNPNKTHFAVAEKGDHPNIYIYEYPSFKLYRILRKGTELSYSSVCFSNNGEIIAAVGSYPDYTISLWNWKQEVIILKAKAFSQEVYSVNFSNYSENILATSGLGHIKFWKVAETFTGLKLKGEIAKFGQVELSDVIGYYIHQDGKVLSGTEYGTLLLWEGNLIKCVIYIDEETQTKCHNGCINVVFKHGDDIVTAADDGYIRFWDYATIDNSESDDFGNFYMKPNSEILIKTDDDRPANITQILVQENFWIVIDANGRIQKIKISENKTDYEMETLLEMNSGRLNDIIVSPIQNGAITVGDDGAVRLWDYVQRKEHYHRVFQGKATCAEWLPYTMKNKSARIILAGFSNGIVRWLLLNQNGFHLLRATKVHNESIKFIKVSPDGSIIAIFSESGDIFLIEQHPSDFQKIDPFCLFETKFKINSVVWDRMGEKLLLACDDGNIHEIMVPKKDQCDTSETYLKEFRSRSYKIRMMESQKPKTEEMELEFLLRRNKNEDKKEEVEWDPESIMNVCYYDYSCTKILATVQGKFLGHIYIIDWNKDRPIDSLPIAKIPTVNMNFVDDDILLISFKDGSWQLRHKNDLKINMLVRTHDRDTGAIKKVVMNHEKKCVMSVGNDGTLFIYKIDLPSIKKITRGEIIEDFQFEEFVGGLGEHSFAEQIELSDNEENEIKDDSVYSIQEAKLLAEEDFKRNEAQKKKDKVKEVIKDLVRQFEQLKQQNSTIDEVARLTDQEMTVDHEFIEMLNKRVEEDLEETKEELKWDAEYCKLKTKKLTNYVKNELIMDTFSVKAIKKSNVIVSTFKVKKMSEFMKQNLEEIFEVIEEEKRNQEEARQNAMSQNLNQTNFGGDQTISNKGMQETVKKDQTLQKQEEDKLKKTVMPNMQGQQQGDKKGETTHLSASKQEKLENKLKEQKIRQEMEELEKKKPTKESFEPDHLRDINHAMETLGDYKLKSSPTYNVPENQRMNESKKKKHMFLLDEFIYNTKMKFNNEIVSLRERKTSLIDKISNYNKRITEINKQLGINETLFTLTLDKQLEAVDQFDVTEEQIDQYEQQKNKETAQQSKKGGAQEKTQQQQQSSEKQDDKEKDGKKEKKVDITAGFKPRKGAKVQGSELEDELKSINQMILNAEKKRMLDEINEEIEEFDKQVVNCQNEKKCIESDMTIAQMKFVTYYQELLILADMEEQDEKYIKDLLNHKREKADLEEQSSKIVGELTALANKDSQNEKELTEQMKVFKELVYPEDDNKREKIHQYYLRKYKKNKAKQLKLRNHEEENEDFDEDEMDSEDDDDDDFMDDDDDEKPDITPVENDTKIREIIDKICDLEDQQETNRKEKADLERQKNQISVKIQSTLKELQKAEEKLRAYQREKLQKVNQLDVSFCLQVDQIKNLIEMGNQQQHILPEDLKKSILFTQNERNKLSLRIEQLRQEQKEIEQSKKTLEKRKRYLQIKINKKNALIDELSKKYNEKHMLKFGDIIDLKILDALEPTKQVLEMREKFKEEEKTSILRVEKAKQMLQEKKNVLLQAKKENTSIITSITKLGQDLMKLSKKLDSTNKQLFKEDNEDKKNKQDLEKERQNYKDLVRFLSKEIEDLKTEIGLFKRKGGHIYTMVTSNKKNFN
ncbi:WD repeat protein (macronuclear) [Tetrahymena thermophila SB210]|uniref:WD repeat protein n=1 Tax=Tetrahymena thermophila (strain SB210) TaxID=312017 RepID=I7LY62_TETTS|nr:WD repeat protein [Tetrahymena thermophila SB210]EAS07768.2 WD repeat protein [Tetrahymena thermophila SB210]|eukprot:XP_001028010.2 WD repeat protein [Tetrahymena thermophila SB210]